jgi:deoxyadenosine/deoxycytidine kinase
MKDLKVKDTNIFHSERFDIDIQRYLPIEKVKLIVQELLEVDDVTDRKIMLDWYLLLFATNVGVDENISIEKYNYFMQILLIDEVEYECSSYGLICDLLSEAESVENTIKKLARSLEESTNKMVKKMPSKQKVEKIMGEMSKNGTENKLKS